MNADQPAGDLTFAYEALRAQATGRVPATTPRGLALVLTRGCAAWLQVWTPVVAAPSAREPTTRDRQALPGMGGEVIELLAEMALSCQRRRWASR